MNAEQFNKKYNDFLEENHYGLAVNIEEVVTYLDGKFQEFIKRSDFKFSQIKSKFGYCCFYCGGLTSDEIFEVESYINNILKKKLGFYG